MGLKGIGGSLGIPCIKRLYYYVLLEEGLHDLIKCAVQMIYTFRDTETQTACLACVVHDGIVLFILTSHLTPTFNCSLEYSITLAIVGWDRLWNIYHILCGWPINMCLEPQIWGLCQMTFMPGNLPGNIWILLPADWSGLTSFHWFWCCGLVKCLP